jgi:hypothetical protein
MPTKRYEIYIKGELSFVKYTEEEFERVCSDMDILNVKYTTEIIDLKQEK